MKDLQRIFPKYTFDNERSIMLKDQLFLVFDGICTKRLVVVWTRQCLKTGIPRTIFHNTLLVEFHKVFLVQRESKWISSCFFYSRLRTKLCFIGYQVQNTVRVITGQVIGEYSVSLLMKNSDGCVTPLLFEHWIIQRTSNTSEGIELGCSCHLRCNSDHNCERNQIFSSLFQLIIPRP